MESRTKLWIFIEVIATITLILGVALTSLDIYPANIYMSALGNLFWLFMGIHWKKWSLILIEAFIIIIYLFGMMKYFLG
jgi:hypothetical protein